MELQIVFEVMFFENPFKGFSDLFFINLVILKSA